MVWPNRSAYAFARGERIGVRMVSTPIETNTSSKLAVNLVSRSRMRNRNRRPASSRSEAKLRAPLCDPWAVRVGGGSEDVHDAALHFDDNQPAAGWPAGGGTGTGVTGGAFVRIAMSRAITQPITLHPKIKLTTKMLPM